MPARNRFADAPHYYCTLFHELIHSTGHEGRLHRNFGDRFGDELYSKEELVAEMGAAFLCAIAGIANEHTDRNSTAYIQNWIEKLEKDNPPHRSWRRQRAESRGPDSWQHVCGREEDNRERGGCRR
jgi:antirestriction protein ArdC